MPSNTRSDLTVLPAPRHARRRATWLLPLGILLGFILLFLLLFRDRLIPSREVAVEAARAIESKSTAAEPAAAPVAAAAGRLLFQASGWIEPDPLPLKVTALTDGIIDEVCVLEGRPVQKGDVLATLIDADARLSRDAAASELAAQQAALEARSVGSKITGYKIDTEKAALLADQASASEAADRLRRTDKAPGGAVPETERVTARLDHARRDAVVLGRQARIAELGEELNQIACEITGLQASVAAARTKLAQAELALTRTRIIAPASGRVLRLLAVPGQKKMVAMDDIDSSTIAILFDPAHLQVRVDVPLADAAGLSVGQQVRIRCNLLPDLVLNGEVTRINGEADIQRNTLQAKVRILNPADQLRPEMLCRAEFLDTAPTAPVASVGSEAHGDLAVFVADSAIADNAVWICDPDTRRVFRRAVTTTAEIRDGYRRLATGVRPGEWVVLAPAGLTENQRVKPKLSSDS